MDQKVREKIKGMLQSSHIEMRRLGQTLLWESDPTYSDYLQLGGSAFAHIIDASIFYRIKHRGKAYIKLRGNYVYKYVGLIENLKNVQI